MSISVIRTREFVVVENRGWEPGEAEDQAVADVMEGMLTGAPVSYDDALRRRRRDAVQPFGGPSAR